ncbi:hypothetical protein [Paenibacillus sp. LK1]|uniref:hypothetical protein n=1 Tax=Paenibacillus sp. LK1 TaxID=2053014 RepID=UPI000C175FCA|nr:hypothetical protein [Paenibacillus sp. LK1]PIH59059.1 hypothetical protein CS562_14040 [Paenibacillus sp. LK1]
MNKEFFGIPLKYWIAVILIPILINVLAWIPNPIAIGDSETWVSFFGSYAGGIAAAFIALLIAKSQTDIAIKQLNHEREQLEIKRLEDETKKDKQEKVFADLVLIYLYDEIQSNLEKIDPSTLSAFEERGRDHKLNSTFVFSYKNRFNYDVFNDIKYDIPKYENKIIIDAITPYKVFKILEKHEAVNKMSVETSKFVFDTISDWKKKLENHIS